MLILPILGCSVVLDGDFAGLPVATETKKLQKVPYGTDQTTAHSKVEYSAHALETKAADFFRVDFPACE